MDAKTGAKYAGLALGAVVVVVVLAFLLGVVGVPQVETIDNEFGAVNDSTTEIRTSITVNNPNPIAISLGGLTIDYAVDMNDVRMATGQKEGLSLGTGSSSVDLVTYLNNSKIPAWWYTHIQRGERSDLVVDADVRSNTVGSHEFTTNKSIRTNILGAFNSSETRPINASSDLVSDPVLYLDGTNATYGPDLTPQRTPLDLSFRVFNPKPHPYVVTKVGYTIYMNNITVGEGESARNTVIPPRPGTETIRATTTIRNQHLDEWWVSHIRNNQRTDLYVDVDIVVEADVPGSPSIPVDSDRLDYRETIETDIFGTKNGTSGGSGATPTQPDGSEPAPGDGPADGGETDETSPTPTPSPTQSPTPTPDDDGGLLAT